MNRNRNFIGKLWQDVEGIRRILYRLQDGRCCYCWKLIWYDIRPDHPRRATYEHLRRKCEGGTNHPDNLAIACYDCNQGRGDMNWLEYATLKEPAQADAILRLQE